MVEILTDALLGAVLITGLVVVMMMMVECLNIETHGSFFEKLGKTRFGQVLLSAFLGVLPGCMGGFASVSLYSHGIISFGALVAMMIASSGDEAFAMLAMFPGDSLWIFVILFAVAVGAGLLVDLFGIKVRNMDRTSCAGIVLHDEDTHRDEKGGRHFSWKRFLMFLGVAAFVSALAFGLLEHGHDEDAGRTAGLNLLSEEWMNILFAVISLGVLAVIIFGSDHFVENHLFNHVIRRHLPKIFAWTFGVLLVLGFILDFCDITAWIGDNVVLMILLATAIGIIPESGPHLIFVTLYAAGVVPFPVLLASCISQDGHSSLPLLAESKSSFLKAKVINCSVALIVGFVSLLFLTGSNDAKAAVTSNPDGGKVSVMTFNIRVAPTDDFDGENCWPARREAVIALITDYSPDFLGVQEGMFNQIQYMDEHLQEYGRYGVPRDDSSTGEANAIFWKKARFDADTLGTFWLSETPDSISRGWDAAYNRVVTWARFREREGGAVFFFFNTHFDHEGDVARRESGNLIVKKMAELTSEYPDAPVFLTGDFNTNYDDNLLDPLRGSLKVAREEAPVTDSLNTFHNWGKIDPYTMKSIIDHIFYKNASPLRYETITGNYGALFVSDHCPVVTEYRFRM